jgi:formate dehydrogenase iron-sulfur subunit
MTTPETPVNTPREGVGLIDALLIEQGRLTAVETFAARHERHEIAGPRYRGLISLSIPAGHQYAFEVDLDKCTGCKACVTACHAMNGLDENEAWREVGLLVSDDWRRPFQQVVTTACHHCVDPACLNGCPVLAYEKDPATGIVRHLDDQCIGCQYCVLKCPYDVPKYSSSRGIVRKCDMCSQRLAVGEAPACVQACPNEAIRITVVEKELLRAEYRSDSRGAMAAEELPLTEGEWENAPPKTSPFLPASPDPSITLPGTRFISRKPLPGDLIPANPEARLQPAHWPLVFMLVLTQLGAGALVCLLLLPATKQPAVAAIGLAAICLGLAISILHLGRPFKAWRSFLGLKKSWLSREIVAFGFLVPLASLVCAGVFAPSFMPASMMASVLWATAALALGGVFCSAMVYHDTQRVFWRGARSLGKFVGTTAILGSAAVWLVTAATGGALEWARAALVLFATLKFAGEHRLFRWAEANFADEVWPRTAGMEAWSLAQSAALMRDKLGGATRSRFFCLITGGIVLPVFTFLAPQIGMLLAAASFCLCLLGELIERYIFFRAVVPPRMPGVL